jgi:hypothetical protein
MTRLVAAAAVALAGCACLCDTDAAVRDRAGSGAIDCGFVPLGADRTRAIECATNAIAASAAVQVGWQDRGRDSEVRTYVAGHDGVYAMFGYDGDPSGGSHVCPTLVETTCTDTPVRTTDALGMPSLSCTGGATRTVCSR